MVQQASMTIVEFQQRFATDDACREHLYKIRWPQGLTCPHCQGKEFYKIQKRNVYECKSCRRQISLTAGTIMHGSHMPLHKWFWAVYMIAKGVSVMRLKRELGVAYGTAWLITRKIRQSEGAQAMGSRDGGYQLAGIVELGETRLEN